MKRIKKTIAVGLAALGLWLGGNASAQAQEAYDFIDAAWADGIPRYIYGSFSDFPPAPEQTNLYIIGPILPNHPQDEVTLEPFYPYHHDHVVEKTPYNERALVNFLIVRPGPNAAWHNVRTRTVEIQDLGEPPIPPEGLEFTPTLEAPWAIRIHGQWQTLRKTETIEDGIAAGILTTVPVVVGVDIIGWSGGLAFDTDF